MNFIHNVVDAITGHHDPAAPSTIVKIKGTVVLMKNNVLDFNDFSASILDRVHELLGDGVSLQLVSATVGDPNLGGRGKVGKAANLEHWIATLTSINAGESNYGVTFEWDTAMGVPGAVIVKNHHHSEFFLKSFTLEDVPGPKSRLFFACNSWVYPTDKYTYDRVFFVNDTYKAEETPLPLKSYREEELFHLRGDNVPGPLQIWDRVYGYAFYNDLGDPDNGEEYVRPILGGSQDLPYPRRARSSRPPSKTDPNTESRLPLLSQLNFYVPRDERFGHLKQSDFLGYFLKNLSQGLMPALNSVFDSTPDEFDSFEDTYSLYEGGPKRPEGVLGKVRDLVPFEMLKELLRTDGERILKLPTPQVIQADKEAWRTDDEYGRETVAGVNPVMITLLTDFPVKSKLDPAVYGNQHSSVCAADLEKNLGGLTVAQAIAKKKLFIVDHHDSLLPFLPRVNTIHKIYASRLFLFLRDDSTLKPIAIELSLPHPDGLNCGAVNQVYTPAHEGVEGSIWLLAKAYAAVNDSGVHQLICHWLNTHAVIEPIVIATHRQLSVLHPIHKLLYPHYKDTLSINALGRQVLINAGGGMEKTVFPDRYAMEMSSAVYKSWKLTEQGLPADLLKRGVAVEDPSAPYGLRLLIEDYPYANDGLAVYHAIQDWVQEYVSIFYPSDAAVKGDGELQAWWKEIREVGHGDKKDEAWWLKMDSCSDLSHTCTTLIWVTSALHAAVNFGQYPYAGYMPNRPTISRKFMPEPGTADYEELVKDPERAYLRTITSQFLTIVGVSLIETLSKHASDEVFLGQRATTEWTSNEKALEVFNKFGQKLVDIEKRIEELNQDEKLKNRNGPVKVPYTLLYPNTSDTSGKGGLLGKGIPNSISI